MCQFVEYMRMGVQLVATVFLDMWVIDMLWPGVLQAININFQSQQAPVKFLTGGAIFMGANTIVTTIFGGTIC